MNLNDLTVDFSELNQNDLLSDWEWLIGGKCVLVLVTAAGNAFLQDKADGCVYFLDATHGTFTNVAISGDEFRGLLSSKEFVAKLFLLLYDCRSVAEPRAFK